MAKRGIEKERERKREREREREREGCALTGLTLRPPPPLYYD
jgi:hypothetical protein